MHLQPCRIINKWYTVICFFFVVKCFRTQKTYKKFLHAYNFTMKIFPTTTHQHFPNCCCPCILVCMYVVASNTTSCLLFSSARGAISSINAHHTRLVKLFLYNLVCPKITLCKYFFDEHLLDEIKANYGASWESFVTCSKRNESEAMCTSCN